MYEGFTNLGGFGMTEEEHQKQVEFLGKEPEDYEKFVADTTAQWLAEEK